MSSNVSPLTVKSNLKSFLLIDAENGLFWGFEKLYWNTNFSGII